MTANETLCSLIAPPYFDCAIRAAKARRWIVAESNLARFSALLPHDHRAALLLAKIRLHEGRLADCLAALEDARRLGHERSENDRMIAWLHNRDQRRYVRIESLRRVGEYWRAKTLSFRERSVYIYSNFWSKWSAHVLFYLFILAIWVLFNALNPEYNPNG